MTHTPNYCCDRLALYLFSTLFQSLSKWTQLQLATEPPEVLASKYFHIFPEDKLPVWTVSWNGNTLYNYTYFSTMMSVSSKYIHVYMHVCVSLSLMLLVLCSWVQLHFLKSASFSKIVAGRSYLLWHTSTLHCIISCTYMEIIHTHNNWSWYGYLCLAPEFSLPYTINSCMILILLYKSCRRRAYIIQCSSVLILYSPWIKLCYWSRAHVMTSAILRSGPAIRTVPSCPTS